MFGLNYNDLTLEAKRIRIVIPIITNFLRLDFKYCKIFFTYHPILYHDIALDAYMVHNMSKATQFIYNTFKWHFGYFCLFSDLERAFIAIIIRLVNYFH